VVDGGRLVGLLTLENVGELIMVSSALQSRSQRGVQRDRLAGPAVRSSSDGAAPPGPASGP
jgi:hypothetical protein